MGEVTYLEVDSFLAGDLVWKADGNSGTAILKKEC